MQKEENTNVLNKDMIGIILSLVWPTMLEQLMQTTVQYIDTAMVGTLGTEASVHLSGKRSGIPGKKHNSLWDRMGIFSRNEEVITLGATVLRMVAVSEPFYGFSIIIEGFMQGVGKTKYPFVYNIIGMWGIRIVGTFICTQCWGLGLVSAWACMILHNLLLFVLFLISYLRGSWNPLYKS